MCRLDEVATDSQTAVAPASRPRANTVEKADFAQTLNALQSDLAQFATDVVVAASKPRANSLLGVIVPPAKIEDFFELGKVLGKGSFGTVYLATDLRPDAEIGNRVALKIMDKNPSNGSSAILQQDETVLRMFCERILAFDHVNIVRYMGLFEDPQKAYVAMEVLDGPDLIDFLTGRELAVSWAWGIMHQLLGAVAYIHGMDVTHRDIKCENIKVVPRSRGEHFGLREFTGILKVVDFGCAAIGLGSDELLTHDPMRPESTLQRIGTAGYIAPEIFQGTYNSKCDVWSMGIVAYILFSGKFPYTKADNTEEFFESVSGPLEYAEKGWESCTIARDLVQMLLTIDPIERPSAQEALARWNPLPPRAQRRSTLMHSSTCLQRCRKTSLVAQ